MIGGPIIPPMDIGANLVSTSKTSNIKSLLLEAWRQRWSPIDWAVNIKRVLPRGVSGDVYDLSNCIIIQALIGPAPNPLFISYLNHCISAHVVSYGAVLSSISKYQEFSKSKCIICLLDLCNDLKKRVNCYGNEEECISLCKAIIALAHWLFSCLYHALNKITELKSVTSNQNTNQFGNLGHHHGSSYAALSGSLGASGNSSVSGTNSQLNEFISITEKSCDILSFISSSSFIKSLFHVGKMEDQSGYSQLVSKVDAVESLLSSGPSSCFPPTLTNAKELSDVIVNFLSTTEWNNRDPTVLATEILTNRELAKGPIIHCSSPLDLFAQSCNTIIAINAILYPTNEIEALARQISLAAKFNDIPYPEVCCEIVRSCFIELVDSSSTERSINLREDEKVGEDLKWAAFTFLKVPHIFAKLDFPKMDKKTISSDLEAGFDKLLMYTPLLDLTDSRSNCDCLDLFLKELCQSEFTIEQKNAIMARRHKDSPKIKDKIIEPAPGSGGQGASLILRAEPTVTSILKTLDSDYSKNQDGLLGVLNHMVPGKSFELILNAAAATGKLKSFSIKLVKFNEFNKQINGEGGKQSQTRALLFDITFLMLCHIAQNYGTDFITQNAETKDSFFATWCAQSLPEGGKYRSSDALLLNCDPLKVDNLLSQFTSPDFELKTSLVKWHEVCLNAPAAIKEVLLAWEHGVITAENVKTIFDNVKSKMCCLPVVISAWLSAYITTLPHEERIKPMNMIQQFMTPASFSETTPLSGNGNNGNNGNNTPGSEGNSNNEPTNTYYKERSMLMSNIIKKMFWDLHPTSQTKSNGVLSTVSHGLTTETVLWKLLEDIFMNAHNRSWLDQRDVYNIDTIFCVGGPNWFVEALLRLLVKFDHASELNKAVGLIYGLFHMDIEQCALSLLVNGLVGYILNENKQNALTEPKASALAKLTVMTVLAALAEAEERRSTDSKTSLKRHGYQRDVSMDFVPMEVDANKVNSVNNTNERPNKMRRTETTKSLNIIIEDTPFFYTMNQQPIDPRILNEPLTKAIADLLRLLSTIIADSVVSQRTLFPLIFLEQLIICGKQDAHKIIQFLPFQAINRLIKMMPGSLSYEFLLSISNLQTSKARKIVARALCQLKTAKVDIPRFSS
ncbi:mediator of RNA polymerase II transcription subunit 24 [Tetranychus urticae]|uniref:Mediator of RNA polymerase II transcription subunit 24 n=1 Tax=Tetranychus urticae TaxID=32264 RepID=T1KD60_TETUR|nr:mediator of RNA polymerase II transcription subunit 24 [Tetranychus urticae]